MAIIRKNYMKIGDHKWKTRYLPGNRIVMPEYRTSCIVCKREPSRAGIPECIPTDRLGDQ